jgi:hypothetical protein
MEASSNLTAPFGARLATAASQIEAGAKLAIACILLSWFFLDTLVVTLGSLQHGVRFFDMSAVIADPSRMFFGFNGWSHRAVFTALCLACLAAPILPHLRPGRALWLAYLAPLALMAICGALLFWRTSGQFIAAPSDANQIAGNVVQFANDLVHHSGARMTRHVAISFGGYLGLVSSLALAACAFRSRRRAVKMPSV